MDQSECKSLNQLIFDLGSRLGSLEGYLYPSLIFDDLPAAITFPACP